jgi:hydroxymethylglutaryl-CoA lyase
VRGYVSTAFWCPYEGKIAPEAVVDVVKRLTDLGVDEISIGDTIGKAVPADVMTLLDRLLDHVDQDRLAMHFHDTYGTAIANVLASYERGISAFDSSAGGVGGCPFAPGASGNVATEDVIRALTQSGATVAPDLGRVRAATDLLASALGRSLHRAPGSTSAPPG